MIKIDSEKLVFLRKLKGKTQAELAEVLGINQGGYSRKEKMADFTEEELNKIAKKLGVSANEIQSETGATIDDLYKFLSVNAIKQESMMKVLLMTVGELLADKKGVPVGTLLEKLTEAVNSQSEHRIEKLKL